MAYTPEIQGLRAKICDQIGRNVLNFQRIEMALKSMVSDSRVSVTRGAPSAVFKPNASAMEKKSLGLVAKKFFYKVVSEKPPGEIGVFSESSSELQHGMLWEIVVKHYLSPEEFAAWKSRLQALIE